MGDTKCEVAVAVETTEGGVTICEVDSPSVKGKLVEGVAAAIAVPVAPFIPKFGEKL